MCDTAVALGDATANGAVIFAKNSDRPPNECQPLCHCGRRSHAAGARVRCQYVEVPQVAETWEVIGARPWWLWGFETGVNEWGVAIGNEAVFAKEPVPATGLLGMDLVRLGLERGKCAREALHVIVGLLEEHGQGGSAVYRGDYFYHNSFLIADPREAWVLETAGRRWVAQRVRGTRNISNVYTIESEWDEASPDLVAYAQERGWCKGARDFNFARAYGDWERPFANRQFRYRRGKELLARDAGRITVETMMAYLRDHYEGTFAAPQWSPQETLFQSICMHTSSQFPSETASGLVAELRGGEAPLQATVWHAFGSPCLSVFRPCYLGGVGLPPELDQGSGKYDSGSPWWAFERLHRRVDANPTLAPVLRSAWQALEGRWLREAPNLEREARERVAAGSPERARSLLRAAVDRAAAEALAGTARAWELLDVAETLVGKADELQPAYRASLNEEAGL